MTASFASARAAARHLKLYILEPHIPGPRRKPAARFRRFLVTAVLLAFGYAAAQECTYETEPNDLPAGATLVTGAGPDSLASTSFNEVGLACISGALSEADGDYYLWRPRELEAGHRWLLEIEGQRGQALNLALAIVPEGLDVSDATELLELSSSHGTRSASPEFLIDRDATYLLHVTGAAGEYVAGIRPVSTLRYGVLDERFELFSPNRSTEAPLSGHAYLAPQVVQSFTVPAEYAGFQWDVELWAALGSAAEFSITGPSGMVAGGSVDAAGYARAADLTLPQGTYDLTLTGETERVTTVRYEIGAAGRVLSGTAIEPNDDWRKAGLIRLGDSVSGTISGVDYFRLEIDDDQASRAVDLTLESDQDVRLGIRDRWGRVLLESRAVDARGLTLAPGAYRLLVEGPSNAPYRLVVSPSTSASGDLEPNDSLLAATPIGATGSMSGDFTGRDTDMFRLEVTDDAVTYGIRLESTGSEWLRLLDSEGAVLADARGSGVLRIDDVLLMPGVHYLAVRGSDAQYRLQATPVDQVPPEGILEIEPNDDASRAIRLQPGATHVGRLTGGSNDYYRFHLADDQYVRIEVLPPAGADGIRVYVDGDGWNEPFDTPEGAITVVERFFLAGDHSLYLRAPDDAGEGPDTVGYYCMSMTQLGVLLPPVDAEPNDTREQARLLPAELAFTGRVGQRSGDYDMFRLPRFASPTFVTVTASGVTGNLNIDFPSTGNVSATGRGDPAAGQPWVAELPADSDVWLRLYGESPYELRVAFSNPPDPAQLLPARTGDQLSVTLTSATDEVAAFWHEGQTVELTATVRNAGSTSQTVDLQTASSHAAVGLEANTTVTVAPGQSVDVPVTVTVPSDLRDDLPLRLEVAAASAEDSAAASVTLAALCEAAPVSPTAYWPLPTALLGRANVLWSGFGVVPGEGSNYVNRDRALIDGRTSPATAGYIGPDNQPTYLLAGDGPVTLLGTILNPQVGNDVTTQLRSFRIETSLDGTNFSVALEGVLKAARIEQAFVFDEPITARYARLSVIDTQGGRDNGYVGEWKLIAAEFPLESVNLADPAVGGHVAWTRPYVGNQGISLVTPGDSSRTVDVRETGHLEFVVGFHDGRAGQVERFEWRDSQGASPRNEQEKVADVVNVAVSMSGAAGPWQQLPDWTLQRGSDGSAVLTLDEPVWARYVRFTVAAGEGVRYIYLPDSVGIYERAPSDDYPSLLGEFGNASRAATFEYLNPPTGTGSAVGADAGDTRQQATPLASGAVVEGSVTVAEDVDWYRMTIPAGSNHLSVTLAGDPQIGYRYELQDANGRRVDAEERSDGGSVELTYFGDPGDYYLLIEEPKRTVVFNWDTSGSVSPYLPITYNSLARFAADVSSEREAVQLLAFDDPAPVWLLPFWSSDTQRVQRAIVEFDRQADSSNSESSLLVATRALADREGTRAILLMTDAESGTGNLTPELWQAFGEVMPRIFTFEISTSGNDYAQDLMQDWADVNGGVYTLATGVGDFDAGFARASCILRRAKGYRVEVTASYVEPPGPGTLNVTRAAGAAQAAVEVIFDASGSMGRELPSGEQRITAAKRALQSLVDEVLPDGTPFALRAFGHIAPSSCETRLDLSLAPLDRAKAASAVAAIEPKLLSQTPLADSLAAVADDLANATAGRTVILITDGVESCKGDPAAAVAALRADGFDFDLAIVSLALEPDALATFTALADAVGASYVDVTSFEELKASIDEALNPAFEVVDTDGAVVARGRVGGAGVELPMGTYTVRVMGPTVEEHAGVKVPGDASVTLSVGAAQ